jgi:hypothetical protein
MKDPNSEAWLCSTGEAQSLIDGKLYKVFSPSGLTLALFYLTQIHWQSMLRANCIPLL